MRGRFDDNPPVYTPYLNIRYDVSDMGMRPLAPGTVYWAPPDIFVSPTDAYGNVQVGTNVTVQAHVFNWGLAPAIAVNVEFYWLNPALGITPANANLIGSDLVTVPAMNYLDVTCPQTWTPTFVNGGHECLIVQCTCPQDPITVPFQPVLDRHVAQRNITVTWPKQGQKLQLSASNHFNSEQSFTLQLSSLSVQCQLKDWDKENAAGLMSLLANLCSHGRLLTKTERHFRLRVQDVTEKDLGVRVTGLTPAKISQTDEKGLDFGHYIRERTMRNPDFNPETLGKVLGKFTLAPQSMSMVDIEMPPAELKRGQFIVHRFTQVAAGCDVGGYSVIVPPASRRPLTT
jgi:hypothetical protein